MTPNDKNKNTNNPKPYPPNERGFLEASEKPVKSHSLEDYVTLPNHVVDPIVVNNIANAEFDYTYNEESDLLDLNEDDDPLSWYKNTPKHKKVMWRYPHITFFPLTKRLSNPPNNITTIKVIITLIKVLLGMYLVFIFTGTSKFLILSMIIFIY